MKRVQVYVLCIKCERNKTTSRCRASSVLMDGLLLCCVCDVFNARLFSFLSVLNTPFLDPPLSSSDS